MPHLETTKNTYVSNIKEKIWSTLPGQGHFWIPQVLLLYLHPYSVNIIFQDEKSISRLNCAYTLAFNIIQINIQNPFCAIIQTTVTCYILNT